ncbi:Rho GTPase activation protein [Boletus edulis]|nr:Rho GTPase activation protein [Boletus edulis]
MWPSYTKETINCESSCVRNETSGCKKRIRAFVDAIGAPLEDVLMYASTVIVIGDHQYHLPVVVVACIEELTKNGIYRSGLFRALPSRDRHLQLIDLFDKSSDFGAHFNMRGQAMPDICALLSTFISSLPAPLLDPQTYSALWHWSVKPSVKREDVRRDRQEEEEEERRAKGEPLHLISWMPHTDFYRDDIDSALEIDQISIAQILLRFLPSINLSLLVYLCGFFTQLPLCPENELQLEDVARIFGHRLLGGSVKAMSQRMMLWLLTRWHHISETLFSEMCGMTPPQSPSGASQLKDSAVATEGSGERIEKRKGKRESRLDDALRYTTSSSSSHSSPSTDSPDDRAASSRKSSSEGEEEGESSGGSPRRKKRELDVQEPHTDAPASRQPTTPKECE